MTDNTPLNADELALRQELLALKAEDGFGYAITEFGASPKLKALVKFILADRKKHELEASLEEANKALYMMETYKASDAIKWFKGRIKVIEKELEKYDKAKKTLDEMLGHCDYKAQPDGKCHWCGESMFSARHELKQQILEWVAELVGQTTIEEGGDYYTTSNPLKDRAVGRDGLIVGIREKLREEGWKSE